MRSHTTTLVLSLLFAIASAAPQPRCTVLLPVIYTLNYDFALEVQNTEFPEIHNHMINFVAVGTPGDYSAVLAPAGEPQDIRLTDGELTLAGRKHTAYLQLPRKVVYQQVAFAMDPENPLEVQATYGCDENGDQQLELSAVGSVFCVAKDLTGQYGLYAKDRDEQGAACVDVIVAVKP